MSSFMPPRKPWLPSRTTRAIPLRRPVPWALRMTRTTYSRTCISSSSCSSLPHSPSTHVPSSWFISCPAGSFICSLHVRSFISILVFHHYIVIYCLIVHSSLISHLTVQVISLLCLITQTNTIYYSRSPLVIYLCLISLSSASFMYHITN